MSVETVESSSFSKRMLALVECNSRENVRKAEMLAALGSVQKEVVLVISYDKSVSMVDSKGEEIVLTEDSALPDYVVHPGLRALVGSAPGNKMIGDVMIP